MQKAKKIPILLFSIIQILSMVIFFLLNYIIYKFYKITLISMTKYYCSRRLVIFTNKLFIK